MLALFCFLSLTGVGRSEDASPFLDVDAAGCEKLDDMNLQVGPPDAEIMTVLPCAPEESFVGRQSAAETLILSCVHVLVWATFGHLSNWPGSGAMRLQAGNSTPSFSSSLDTI
jgi:hypothetical protein